MALPAKAVYEIVVVQRPFRTHSLAGVVVDPSGAILPGATVDDCDPTFSRVLATTTTDSTGYFAFSGTKIGSNHYLRFRSRGFNPLEISVKLRHFAPAQLRVKLPIGG
jgi:hypothetical protein